MPWKKQNQKFVTRCEILASVVPFNGPYSLRYTFVHVSAISYVVAKIFKMKDADIMITIR